VDSHPIFQRQWAKRRSYYKKEKYTIQEIELDNYINKGEWITTFKNGEKCNKCKSKASNLLTGKCLID
jgi:hypothetical protein